MSWFIGLPYSLSRGTPFFYRKFLQHDCGRAGLELGVPWLSGVGPGLNFLEIPMPVVGAVECVGFPFGSGPGRLAYSHLRGCTDVGFDVQDGAVGKVYRVALW